MPQMLRLLLSREAEIFVVCSLWTAISTFIVLQMVPFWKSSVRGHNLFLVYPVARRLCCEFNESSAEMERTEMSLSCIDRMLR